MPFYIKVIGYTLFVCATFYLGFYWGHYYGKGVYRFCRYWRLKFYRRFIQKRPRWDSKIELGR